MQSTATNLLRRAKDHDQQAWQLLVQLYGPLVYSWCRKSQLQPADAADAVQEVFQGVAVGLETFQRNGAGSFRGWLKGITRHKISDILRKKNKQPQVSGGTTAQERIQDIADSIDVFVDDSPPESRRHDLLHSALEHLRSEVQDTTWRVFWKTTVEDCAPDEVAREFGMKLGTVYQAKSRALIRLREILTQLQSVETDDPSHSVLK